MCSYFNNFGRMWLVNELVLTFWTPIKYAKAQFNLIILSSYRAHDLLLLQTERHFRINRFFLTHGDSKHKDLMKISELIIYIKPTHSD